MALTLCLVQIPQLPVGVVVEQVLVIKMVVLADREVVVEETHRLLDLVLLEHQDKEIVVPIQRQHTEVAGVAELVQLLQEQSTEDQVVIGNLLVLFTQEVVVAH
jgi:hypothetical protein